MVSSIPLEACLCDLRSLTVSSELLGCPIGIHLCLSTFPTSYTNKKGKRYLLKAHASHAIRVCYLLFCVPCIFLCVCSAWLRSLQLFLELSIAPSLEPDFSLFSCFSSSCLSLSLAPSLKPFLLALILFTIHLECRWITNTHLEIGFLSTSEMSTVLLSMVLSML